VTLVIVGILGTVLKLLADDYQAKRLRLAQQSEFRLDKYRRLVQITNMLRRIPLLVPVDWSEETLRKCLFDILDVGAELRVTKREAADRIGETHLLHTTVGFRMGADCFPDDVGLARCDLRTEAE
jgi:hypothetical protein